MSEFQAPVCLGPVSPLVTLAEQRCDTISPGVYPAFSLLPGEGFCGLFTFCGLQQKSSVLLLFTFYLHRLTTGN